METKQIKEENAKEISRVFLINKRDRTDEYIHNCVAKYNQFLANKDEPKEMKDLNNLLKNKDTFFKKSVEIFDQVEAMRKEILKKRDDFVAAIKEYANLFINQQKELAREDILGIEENQKKLIANIKKEIANLNTEKTKIKEFQNETSKKIRIKIQKIKDEVNLEHKFDLKEEEDLIKKIYDEHKTFTKVKIEDKLIVINQKLDTIHKELKYQTLKRMSDISLVISKAKDLIKKEFIFLAKIEKKIIKQTIYFKDFLEDVEYFTNDKARKYEIVLANARQIKINSSQKIMKDVNNLILFVANSEKIFDSANELLVAINQRVNNNFFNSKLSNYQESVLNSTTAKLLGKKIEEDF